MALLKIIKLSTKTWKHNSDVDGDFILTKFYAKQEDNEFLLVETYGSKRRKYLISEIEVYDIGGSAELFTNFDDLFLRLEALKYPAFYIDGEVDLSTKVDKVSTSGVERAYIINADGSQGTKPTSDFGGESNIEVITLQNRWTLTNANTYYRSRGDYAGFNDAIMTITTLSTSYATLTQLQRGQSSFFYFANGNKKLHKIAVDISSAGSTITSYTLMVVACQRTSTNSSNDSTINGINLGEYTMTKTSGNLNNFHIITPTDVTIPDGYIVTCFLKRADGTAEINCSIMFQFKNA